MERTEVLDMMSGLKLYGMRSAYDETLAVNRRGNGPPDRRARGTPWFVTDRGGSARLGEAGLGCAAGASADR